ncbi:MAG: hypothetical protein M3Y86_04790 [Verrucomicrobiota bacterium]|nr:hypothetical protein [Verrucomicrobiota bacterium]
MSSARARRLLVRPTLLALIFFATALSARATGYYGPMVYLDDGGRRVTGSPEFYWELEVKRLARDFHPPERLVVDPALETVAESLEEEKPILAQRTAQVDHADFAAALREGRIQPPDAAAASAQQDAARAAIDHPSGEALPPEFPSEFADYHRGAFFFALGPAHWEEARQAWEALLARPPNERHDRSVWAAFMLGKLALKEGGPEATTWFQRTRELARDGFADSLGMAADSYGWEARSEYKRNHPANAAPLYLTQLALGDTSAIVSLKALIPDRQPVEGMLNYGSEPAEKESWDDAKKRADENEQLPALKAAAHDPLLRRLVTVHILATQADPYISEDTGRPAVPRAARWLEVVRGEKIEKIEDAEYLGWIAYGDGKYEQAERWLTLSSGDTPAGLWLKAKLQLRAGKIDEATRTMAKAWETLRDDARYTGWAPPVTNERSSDDYRDRSAWSFAESASGDLGGLRLARTEFVASLDAFVKGELWNDAAFIAERVLILDELKKYVDAQPPAEAKTSDEPGGLRYLLGRRLVREDRYAEAGPYLPAKYQELLGVYAQALHDASSKQLAKSERARAYFDAAWIARYNGMELMGTEGAPDGGISGGSFPEPDLAGQRASGTWVETIYATDGDHKKVLPVALPASAKEKARLAANKIRPDVRFHYRVIAAALAIHAAELLPDNSAELADTLNYAGRWAENRDEKMAARCYNLIERRGAQTEIGRAVLAKHWFVEQTGPWSAQKEAARTQTNGAE